MPDHSDRILQSRSINTVQENAFRYPEQKTIFFCVDGLSADILALQHVSVTDYLLRPKLDVDLNRLGKSTTEPHLRVLMLRVASYNGPSIGLLQVDNNFLDKQAVLHYVDVIDGIACTVQRIEWR
jgi:hypothetical protein